MLSKSLAQEHGKGFSRRNLFRTIRSAEIFPDEQIVSTLSAQLSWPHFLEIIPLRDLLQRGFYAEMCRVERWSVRTSQNSPSSTNALLSHASQNN